MKKNNFTVNNNQDGKRLFIVVSEHLSISKKQSQKIIDEKLVLINKKRIWMRNHNVKINDHIEILSLPGFFNQPKQINIIWKDEYYMIVNKPPGLISNAHKNSLENILRLQEKNSNIAIGLSDPLGSALYNYYEYGELKAEGNSISEGIGQGRITANLELAKIDNAFQVSDEEALPIVFDLHSQEGLLLGGSRAINVAGAIRLAKELGPGKTIVTILCDSGARYFSKLWNPNFLKEKNLPIPSWL